MSDRKKWTVMVYMAGDNDLYEDMTTKVVEIERFFQTNSHLQNIGLSVYFDGGNPLLSTCQIDFSGDEPVIEQASQNAADVTSVYDFVKWTVQKQSLEADNYALIFSGHGDGFQRTAFMRDMTSFDFMTVKMLKEELSKINKSLLGREKLQVLAFDSCVMSMLEVVNEFKEVAELMTSSEGYVPTTGLSYKSMVEEFAKLDDGKNISSNQISEIIVKAAKENNIDFSELSLRSLDASILDLNESGIDLTVQSVNNLGVALQDALTYQKPLSENDFLTVEAIKKVILSAHFRSQTFLYDQAVDIVDFCEILKSECLDQMFEKHLVLKAGNLDFMKVIRNKENAIESIKITKDFSDEEERKFAGIISFIQKMTQIVEDCEKVIENVKQCVLQTCFSGPDYQYARGLAVFFPWSKNTFSMTKHKFKEYGFACRSENALLLNPWYEFLQHYLSETLRPTVEIDESKALEAANERSLDSKAAFSAGIRVLLDPPPRGMLASETQYKEYFRRIKNFPLENISGCRNR